MPDLSLDWFLFLLRLAFILLLYLFLYQLVQVTLRDLLSRAENASADAGGRPARAPQRRAAATLVITSPGATGLPPGIDVPLSALTTVGRHATNLVPLDDPSVSGQHAEIALVRDRWWLRDLDSTNGTYLNGDRVDGGALLTAGDLVQFGRVSGRFHL